MDKADLFNPANQLPCFDEPTFEPSVGNARLVGVPRRRDLLNYCFKKMGWNLRDFCVYRLAVAHPTMDTMTKLMLKDWETEVKTDD